MSLAQELELFITTHFAALKVHLPNGVPAGLPAQVAELTTILTTYDTARAAIDANPRLSADGKFADAQAAYNTAQADIAKWRNSKVGGLDKQLATLRAALLAKAGKATPEPTPLQVSNMVTRLAEFEPLEVEVLYADATDAERRIIEVVAEALGRQPVRRDNALSWEPILAPERISDVVLARAERFDAEGAAQVRDLQRIRNTFEGLAGTAKGLVARSLHGAAA